MGVFHWGCNVNNWIFQGSGVMFTESVRVGCNFLVCHGGSAKYQTCLIFHRSSVTLHAD